MKNAMEDAILCNARINTIEASDMYLFIDKAFQEKEKNKFITITILLVSIVFCLYSAIVCFVHTTKKTKKKSGASQ